MRHPFVVLACVFALAFPPQFAHGDECTGLSMTPKKMLVQGAEGLWLPSEQLACLAKRAEQTAKLEGVVEAQDALTASLQREVDTSAKALASAEKLADKQEKRGDEFKAEALKQAETADKLRDEMGAWYRSPLLWAGVGAVAIIVALALVGAAPNITIQ